MMKIADDDIFQAILEHISDGVYVCDRDRRISYWSPGAERITGYTAAEVHGVSCAEGILTHVDESGTSLCNQGCPVANTMADGLPRESQVYLHHKEGYRVPVLVRTVPVNDATGEVTSVVEVFTDNSTLLEALERVRQLSLETETDPLTGIGNRRSMEAKLQASVKDRRRLGAPAGVLFIDIDHFKNVNDTLGHEAGDRVLKMVARTLDHNLRSSDSLARWGGEEFLVLLEHVDAQSLVTIAEKLRMLMGQSYLETEDGTVLRVTVSIGATLIRPTDTQQSVVSRADRLLYQSKIDGRDRVTWAA
jgi:diguanylate cyclase (GGDEF)-like protein/PAS domain S-box-containing protein